MPNGPMCDLCEAEDAIQTMMNLGDYSTVAIGMNCMAQFYLGVLVNILPPEVGQAIIALVTPPEEAGAAESDADGGQAEPEPEPGPEPLPEPTTHPDGPGAPEGTGPPRPRGGRGRKTT